jgi:hypothetical protein
MIFSAFIPSTLPYLYICSNKKPCVRNCTYISPYVTIQGLLSPVQMKETRKAEHTDPGSGSLRLGPRAFSAGVVDSLGEGFVKKPTNKNG